MTLGTDGRLVRDGLELEMSAYCRRAVAQAVAIAAEHGGTVTVVTLGPPAGRGHPARGHRVGHRSRRSTAAACSSPTPRSPAPTRSPPRARWPAALVHLGGFDLVLAGRNSVDADTGQVGPELAELLGLPFVTGARHLTLAGTTLDIRAEHDDGWAQVRVDLPAVVSTAERLIDPCKVDPAGRAAVPADRITAARAPPTSGPGRGVPRRARPASGATRVVDVEPARPGRGRPPARRAGRAGRRRC